MPRIRTSPRECSYIHLAYTLTQSTADRYVQFLLFLFYSNSFSLALYLPVLRRQFGTDVRNAEAVVSVF